jgi:hypothetical protein
VTKWLGGVTEKVLVTSWLEEEMTGKMFFEGHMVKKREDERNFGDHVIRKGVMKIFNDHMVRRRGDESFC